MRYLEQLIDRARENSQNTRYDANSGVSQRTFTQFFQNAQDFMTKEIINTKGKYLLERTVIPVVNGQEPYDYPQGLVLQGIDTIEWSQDQTYWTYLEKCIPKDQQTSMTGYPFGYVLSRRQFFVTPFINYGYLRINYNKRPNRLEKRSAKVTGTAGTPITAITLDSAFAGDDQSYINEFSSITIVDRDGVPKVANIPITSCSGNTIVVPNYTLQTGEAIAAGDFVLAGGYSTNQPDFDDLVESFLILYATYQAKYGDSSQWTDTTLKDVSQQAQQIIGAFATLSEDVSHIPIINTDFLSLW